MTKTEHITSTAGIKVEATIGCDKIRLTYQHPNSKVGGVDDIHKYDTRRKAWICYKPIGLVGITLRDADTTRLKALARQRKAELLPGLDELEAAYIDELRHQHDMTAMMEDENNDGVRPPKPAETSYAELARKYPAAAAYRKAKAYTLSENVGKYSAGRRAVDRLEAGDDYNIVMQDMQSEWSNYASDHATD